MLSKMFVQIQTNQICDKFVAINRMYNEIIHNYIICNRRHAQSADPTRLNSIQKKCTIFILIQAHIYIYIVFFIYKYLNYKISSGSIVKLSSLTINKLSSSVVKLFGFALIVGVILDIFP